MHVRLVPNEAALPSSGGVRQHCVMLRRFIEPLVTLTDDPGAFTHVQSSYTAERCDVYTCHGGFLPSPPIQPVVDNLHKARHIISVAKWIVDIYFPDLAYKTIVIPNGVCLTDWDAVPEGESGIELGYILIKGYHAWPEHWRMIWEAMQRLPDMRFVAVGQPAKPGLGIVPNLPNLDVFATPIPESKMQRIIKDCAAFISPSSEVNPVMAMEAMACCKPVVGLNLHGNREVIGSQLLYDDVNDLEDILGGMLGEQKQRIGWGGYYRHKMETKFNWETLAHDILAVYESVA